MGTKRKKRAHPPRLPRAILDTVESLGLTPKPVDQRSRHWLAYQRGLARLVGRDLYTKGPKKGQPKPVTTAQARELAAAYRYLRNNRGRTGVPRREYDERHPEWQWLSRFNRAQTKRAKTRHNTVIDKLDSLPRSKGDVVFLPDDARGIRKRFLNYDEFRKFATLPHYKSDFQTLLGKGKFVVGHVNSDTGELYKYKNGKPKYSTVLARGTIEGAQSPKKSRRKSGQRTSPRKKSKKGKK